MHMIEEIELREHRGELPAEESRDAIRDLGVGYQLVTDHTAMVVLSEAAFERRGIERRNRERVARERQARVQRQPQAPVQRRVDRQEPMFRDRRAPSVSGGGAIDPFTGLLALGLGLGALVALRRRGQE